MTFRTCTFCDKKRKHFHPSDKGKCYRCAKRCYICEKKRRKFRESDGGKCTKCANWEMYQRQRRNSYGISEGFISRRQWLALCASFDNRCVACGLKRLHLTLDHVVPYHLGGTHTFDNIQPLCYRCNRVKAAKHIDFRESALNHIYVWSNRPHAIATRNFMLRFPVLALKMGAFL